MAIVRDAFPEPELLVLERVVVMIGRVLTGKEMRVLLPADSSLRVEVLTVALNACFIEWPRMASALEVRNGYVS
jgi:hypothetical protein